MRIKLLVCLYLVACVFGVVRMAYFYHYYAEERVFSALSVYEKRVVIARLVRTFSFDKVLIFLRSIYVDEAPSTHGISHLLGEEAYRAYGNTSFGMCDAIFNYGCYHGVVDMAVRTKGLSSGLVRSLYDACTMERKDASPCIHPLGHASAIVTGYNLLEGFSLCDEIYPDTKVAFSCWNGVMMEYINRASPTAPKHVYGDLKDSYAPCNSVPEKYEASCVSQHVTYLLSHWNNDFVRLGNYCLSFSRNETIIACVESFGVMAAQTFFRTPQQVVDVCAIAGDKRSACLIGAVVPFVTAKNAEVAVLLCNNLKTDTDHEVCFERIRSVQSGL